jgi:hypothetical protein
VAFSYTQPKPDLRGEDMPLVRIDLVKGRTQEYRTHVGDIVYRTMVDVLHVPKGDRFQVIQ